MTPTPTATEGPRTIEQQLASQELVLAEGETAIRYRDIVTMFNTLGTLASRALPTKGARIHIARCRRALKEHADDYTAERQRIQNDHMPAMEEGETLAEGDTVQFRDPLGLAREYAELDAMCAAVKLPSRITDAMLPVNDKAHPNNEDGLALIMADLLLLYTIDDEPEKS